MGEAFLRETDLLDPEAWDAPRRLSRADCLDQTGPDWHRAGDPDTREDDR